MSCIINQNIQNCNYILDGINKLYISSVKNVEYSFEDNEFIDIFTEMNWFEIEFNAIEFNTEYQNKIYSTTITVQINNINNEINVSIINKTVDGIKIAIDNVMVVYFSQGHGEMYKKTEELKIKE